MKEKHLALYKEWIRIRSKFNNEVQSIAISNMKCRDRTNSSAQLKQFERDNLTELVEVCKFNEVDLYNIRSSRFFSLRLSEYIKLVTDKMTVEEFLIEDKKPREMFG
jgi:hypothetical protein